MPRHVGTPNRITSELREKLQFIIAKELESIDDNLSQLSAKERLEIVTRLIGYVIPKLKEITQFESKEIPTEIKVNIVKEAVHQGASEGRFL